VLYLERFLTTNKMRKLVLLSIVMAVGLTSCQPGTTEVTAPADYTFLRDGDNTVFMGGQTDRLAMGVELGGALKDFSKSAIDLKEMFANEDADGNDVDPYASASLNASSKSVRSKTASSVSYFGSNASSSAAGAVQTGRNLFYCTCLLVCSQTKSRSLCACCRSQTLPFHFNR
jgi:hypothetical protein